MFEFTGPEAAAARTLREELPRLVEQWERLGAPIAGMLAPGISPEEVDRLAAPHGLRAPVEVKALWEWHNGLLTATSGDDTSIGPGGYQFLSVEQALEAFVLNRAVHSEAEAEAGGFPDAYWHASWLPIFVQDAQRLYVDCDRAVWLAPGTAPLRPVPWEWSGYDRDVAPSLVNAVHTWTWLLQQDYYRVEAVDGRRIWQVDWLAIPDFLRVGSLA